MIARKPVREVQPNEQEGTRGQAKEEREKSEMPEECANEGDEGNPVTDRLKGSSDSRPAGQERSFPLRHIQLAFPGCDRETVKSAKNGEENDRDRERKASRLGSRPTTPRTVPAAKRRPMAFSFIGIGRHLPPSE